MGTHMAAPEELGVLNQSLLSQLLVKQLVDLRVQTLSQLEHKDAFIMLQPDVCNPFHQTTGVTGSTINMKSSFSVEVSLIIGIFLRGASGHSSRNGGRRDQENPPWSERMLESIQSSQIRIRE